MAGRTHNKYTRVYVNGVDLSGDARTIGPLDWTYEIAKGAAMADGSQNVMLGQPTTTPGTLNSFLNFAASGALSGLASSTSAIVTVAIGDKAAPTEGDPCFNGNFSQLGYQAVEDGWVAVNIPFGEQISTGANNTYGNPWGILLTDGIQERDGVNALDGILGSAAQTTAGGFGILHLISGNGTCTFKIQDCATVDGVYADLLEFDTTACDTEGADSPFAEIKATAAITTTVDKYLRWQLEFGTADSVRFLMAFVRGR